MCFYFLSYRSYETSQDIAAELTCVFLLFVLQELTCVFLLFVLQELRAVAMDDEDIHIENCRKIYERKNIEQKKKISTGFYYCFRGFL